jgi:hypothetical protein
VPATPLVAAVPKTPEVVRRELSTQTTQASLQQDYEEHLTALESDNRFSVTSPQDRAHIYEERRTQQVDAAVRQPPSPRDFMGIQTGPDVTIEHEASLLPQVDSTALLRRLSPFMIQVEPPIAFGEAGGFLTRNENSVNVDVYDRAMSGYRAYETARRSVASSSIAVGVNGQVSSVSEFLRVNSSSTPPTREKEEFIKGQEGRLGEPAMADMLTAVDTAWQLSALMQAPPLVLLINPQSIQISYTKVQQFQDRSRYGYIFHAWGEEQPKLSITARCGAFFSGGRGLQYASKRDSSSWQNLMGAFQLYRNNGYIYDTVGKSNAHLFVGALSIHYDQWVYYGHMENFNWTYEEGNQLGNVEFSMEFTVSAMADTAEQVFAVTPLRSPIPSLSDPRYAGMESRPRNRPGEYSIGFDDNAVPRVTTQGRVVTGSDFGVLVPGGLEPVLAESGWRKASGGSGGRPIGTRGFQDPTTGTPPGQRTVTRAAAQFSGPFGLR